MNQEEYWRTLYNNKATSDVYKSAARSGLMSYNEMAIILNKFLEFNKKDNVADIGGASAGLALEVSKLVNGVVMVDYSPSQVKIAKRNVKKVNVKNVTCLNDSFPDLSELPSGAFSKAFSGACMQYLDKSKIYVAMKNLFRILDVSGQAAIFHCHSEKMKKGNPHGKYNHLISFYSFEELRLAAQQAGFKSCEEIRFAINSGHRDARWDKCITVDNPNLSLNILLKK